MKIQAAYNKSEIAERYYKKLGKFTTRPQANKNFFLLKRPKLEILREIFQEIHDEQIAELSCR